MTHLVSPTSFRLGKTHTWKANGISKNSINTNVVSTKIGINSLLKYMLRRRRLYVVKSSIRIYSKHINIKSLFMPRIKVKPKSDGLGCFSKYMLYKRHNQTSSIFLNSTKMYIDERRLKVFKFPHKKNSQINRWISRRMLRGSHDTKFKTSFRLDPNMFSNKINNCSYYMNKVWIKNKKHKKYPVKSQKKIITI